MKSRFLLLLVFVVKSLVLFGQDSIYTPAWKVTAIKEAEGHYQLQFTTAVSKGWKLYQPGQVLLDMPVAGLQFADSLIKIKKELNASVAGIKTPSEIFAQEVLLQDGEVSWLSTIQIDGTVPAQLQGTLLFTYGKGDFIIMRFIVCYIGKLTIIFNDWFFWF